MAFPSQSQPAPESTPTAASQTPGPKVLGASARQVALAVLRAVHKGAYADVALHRALAPLA